MPEAADGWLQKILDPKRSRESIMEAGLKKGRKMTERTLRPLAIARPLMVAAGIMIATMVLHAEPVEYVRVCSLFGAGFSYLPGTDICVNTSTNDAREETGGGVWRWRIPDNPRTSLQDRWRDCDGELVKFGEVTSSGLVLNSYSRLETSTRYPLNLKPGQYISSIIYSGGFNFSSSTISINNLDQTFCMYYYSSDEAYLPLGCLDSSSPATANASWAFTPDRPIPPPDADQIYLLGAFGQLQQTSPPSFQIQGTLSISFCVKNSSH
jgi:hypothetical protein